MPEYEVLLAGSVNTAFSIRDMITSGIDLVCVIVIFISFEPVHNESYSSVTTLSDYPL